MEKELLEHHLHLNRRSFLAKTAVGIGGLALANPLEQPLAHRARGGLVDPAANTA
jgi:hypothetical protein